MNNSFISSMLDLSTNRGNELLVKMLSCRYPKLQSDDALSLLYSALDQPILTAQEDLRDTELVYTNYIKEPTSTYLILAKDIYTSRIEFYGC